jgi:flagellar biogenesis protein FliO
LAFLKDNVAQISAEMIIVLAALLAVAIILVTKLSSTSKQAADKVDEKTTNLLENIDDIN